MDLLFECKTCHVDIERPLETLRDDGIECPKCGQRAESDLLSALVERTMALADTMASMRADFRFEVLLETDDLPAPHGFDADYTLPESRPGVGAPEPDPKTDESSEAD